MRLLVGALFLTMVTSAAADIRIDDDDRPRIRPTPEPVEQPVAPPVVEQKKGGCVAREGMGPEWMFGLAVLGLGLAGVRRFAPRRATAA